MKTPLLLVFLLLTVLVISADYAELYNKGMECLEKEDFSAAVVYFNEALTDCPSSDRESRAKIHLRIGEACYQLYLAGGDAEHYFTAEENLEKAYLLSGKNSAVANFLKKIRYENRDLIVPAKYITRSFTNKKAFGVEPSIDLLINFDLNKATLNENGLQQAHQLGKALSDPAFRNNSFLIAGHTDKTGTDVINNPLSYNRARTVKDFLVSNYALTAERIKIEGKGSHEPKYKENTDMDYSLNRRVEVKIIE